MKNNKKSDVALSTAQREFVEKLINENQTSVNAIVRNVLGTVNGYMLEDCISEIYLLLCKKISLLEKHPNPKAWLYVAAKMMARTVIFKNKNDNNNVPLEFLGSTTRDPTYDEVAYHIYLESDVNKKILEKLTYREAQVYEKIFLQKKSVKEVANELHISESAVRTHKMAVKEKIAKLFDKGF